MMYVAVFFMPALRRIYLLKRVGWRYRMNRMKRKKKAKFSKKQRFVLRFLGTMAGLLLLVYAGLIFLKSWIKPPDYPDIEDAEAAFANPEGNDEDMLIGGGSYAPEGFTNEDRKELFYTFLIFGLDGGVNTDTIMVASYDGINNAAAVINIPRDSLVNVKRSLKKINAAYPVGTQNGGGHEGGVSQLKREIKTIIGFSPDFYICIDLEAFERIVDAVGGVELYVPFDMKYDDPYQDLHIDIKKGDQRLNGAEALKFARYRKGNNSRDTISDYTRIEHQQTVIKAVLGNLLKPANILKIPEFIDIFSKNVRSDMKIENMLWFAEQLNQIRGADALSTYTIPTAGTSGLPSYYEYLDEAGIVELVNQSINPYKKDIQAKDIDIVTGIK